MVGGEQFAGAQVTGSLQRASGEVPIRQLNRVGIGIVFAGDLQADSVVPPSEGQNQRRPQF